MQRVFQAGSLWEANEVLRLLRSHGISAALLNEQAASTPGAVIAANQTLALDAEVWVHDPDLAPWARQLIEQRERQLRAVAPAATWQCDSCGEENPASFDWCWRCGPAAPAAARPRRGQALESDAAGESKTGGVSGE